MRAAEHVAWVLAGFWWLVGGVLGLAILAPALAPRPRRLKHRVAALEARVGNWEEAFAMLGRAHARPDCPACFGTGLVHAGKSRPEACRLCWPEDHPLFDDGSSSVSAT